jgi:calcineurin-like phosphoesterase family protein
LSLFFSSDTHFGHGGALGLFRRPFASVEAMNEALIARWNETVGPADTVWHLGDVAVRRPAEEVAAILDRLHGTLHLVTGNTDSDAVTGWRGWASVQTYAELEAEGRRGLKRPRRVIQSIWR